ncbi:Protein of unknown function [Gryllus bimaculatus]|nr:Protein of unknown function [Gryllus bimaculatus]
MARGYKGGERDWGGVLRSGWDVWLRADITVGAWRGEEDLAPCGDETRGRGGGVGLGTWGLRHGVEVGQGAGLGVWRVVEGVARDVEWRGVWGGVDAGAGPPRAADDAIMSSSTHLSESNIRRYGKAHRSAFKRIA